MSSSLGTPSSHPVLDPGGKVLGVFTVFYNKRMLLRGEGRGGEGRGEEGGGEGRGEEGEGKGGERRGGRRGRGGTRDWLHYLLHMDLSPSLRKQKLTLTYIYKAYRTGLLQTVAWSLLITVEPLY